MPQDVEVSCAVTPWKSRIVPRRQGGQDTCQPRRRTNPAGSRCPLRQHSTASSDQPRPEAIPTVVLFGRSTATATRKTSPAILFTPALRSWPAETPPAVRGEGNCGRSRKSLGLVAAPRPLDYAIERLSRRLGNHPPRLWYRNTSLGVAQGRNRPRRQPERRAASRTASCNTANLSLSALAYVKAVLGSALPPQGAPDQAASRAPWRGLQERSAFRRSFLSGCESLIT